MEHLLNGFKRVCFTSVNYNTIRETIAEIMFAFLFILLQPPLQFEFKSRWAFQGDRLDFSQFKGKKIPDC